MKDSLRKIIDRVWESRDKSLGRYSFGIIYQPESTIFNFLDGTQGYGSPYVPEEDKDKVVFVRDSGILWQRAYQGKW